ncbi:MAG: ABC transporter permease [Dehalococcoidia bacterium]|nr:ABC transporter permease [Dehalococcoidia bacterium]
MVWHPRRYSWLLALAGLLLAWQAAALLVHDDVLPTPVAVAPVLVRQMTKGDLATHLLVSGYRVVLSVALAVGLAMPVGLVLGLNKTLNAITSPVVYISYPIPKIVLLPVLLLFLGIGDTSKIAMIFLILFFQVLIVVRDAAQGVRPELVHSVRSLGAGPWHLLRYVFFPATLPSALTALRVSTGTAIAVLFFVESFGTSSGLGYYILVESWGALRYREMYAGVVAMAFLGLAIYFLLDLLQRKVCAWVQL